MSDFARVCVVSALRDVAAFLPFYRYVVQQQTHWPTRVLLGENDSVDQTWRAVRAWGKDGATVFDFQTKRPLLPREATAERSAHLARVRNLMLDTALQFDDWDYLLFLDAQKWIPPYALATLLHAADQLGPSAGILAPIVGCVGGPFYDTWCFRHLNGDAFTMDVEGRPLGRRSRGGLLQIGAAGGVMLIRRAVIAAGCRLAGTDGTACDSVPLCTQARAAGFEVWMDQRVVAVHCATSLIYGWLTTEPPFDPPCDLSVPARIMTREQTWRAEWADRFPRFKIRADQRYQP